MSFLTRIFEGRKRRRTHSHLDAPWREAVRSLERKIKFLLANPLGALLRPKRVKIPLSISKVSSILILRYDALGDAVLTTPVWRSIKKHAPHIKVGVAASARNQILLRADPDIDEVFIFSKAPSFQLLRELFRAKKTRWDIVINLYFHDKTRAAIYSKIVSPLGISITGVRGNNAKYERIYSVVASRPPLPPPTPMVEQCLLILKEVLDIPIDVSNVQPSLPKFGDIAPSFSNVLDELMQHFGKDDYIIINTDSSQAYKEWGVKNSLALGGLITERHPKRHVFLSSAPERAKELRAQFTETNEMSYLETPSILHLSVAVRGAVAVVSPDTSVIHFATAEGVPVVGLYLEENEFLPYSSASRVLIAPDGRNARLIPVEQVYQALNELIS